MSAAAVQTSPSTDGEQYKRQFQSDFPKVPVPIYRHAAPSAPWPWMNFDISASEVQPIPLRLSDDFEWGQYPQSLFKNWTSEQVNRSQMLTKCSDGELSTVYNIGVFNDGSFDRQAETRIVRKDDAVDLRGYWNYLGVSPPSNVRVQALFVEDMTSPVLQILGTRYNVEPFFFASSVNWTPSRYREDPRTLEDHITVILPFIRTLKNQRQITRTKPIRIPTLTSSGEVDEPLPYTDEKQVINTQAALSLPENKVLVQDLLSLHMVRKTTTSTIISYHPSSELQRTSAKLLQSLVKRTGDSVYWSNIFKRSKDPTFLFLAILWLRHFWSLLTQELHRLHAHLLYYQQLLQDFLRSVEFVRGVPNPAMNAPSISEAEREDSAKLLRIEADRLISEIERLSRQREMLCNRLDNAIRLTFATVKIHDSKATQGLAEVVRKDSTAIKQIAYLAIVYLPATYLANVFRMDIVEIKPTSLTDGKETLNLADYIEAVAGLTLFTSWLIIALQKDSHFHQRNSSVLRRAWWPLFYGSAKIKGWLEPANRRSRRDGRLFSTSDEQS
ncbi:hypothetical protein OG21DRAFT_1186917 [Imleria badia]|nr:hypothetical protein OG21DRAFT_1186917 [Imleria badia]